MSVPSCPKVSAFREAAMQEVDSPKVTPRSSYNSQMSKSFQRTEFNYKPLALRSIPLLSLLAITLALIGALQYAIVQLPDGLEHLDVTQSNSTDAKRDLNIILPRQNDNTSSTATSSSATTSDSASSTNDGTPTVDSSSSITSSSDTITTTSSSSSTQTRKTRTTDTESEDSTTPTQNTKTKTTSTQPTPTSSSSSEPDDTDEGDGKHTKTTSVAVASSLPPAYTTASTAYVPTDKTSTIAFDTASTAYLPSTATVTLPAASASSDSNNTDDHPNEDDGAALQSESLGDQGKQAIVYQVWDASDTFLGTYLAVLVAVVYRMLWTAVYNNFNLIDPFRQLMQPNGADAATAFFAFYQSQSNLLGPLPALLKGRWTLAAIAFTYLVACLLPALASESMFVVTDWNCTNPNLDNTNNPCPPRIGASTAILRSLQGLLAFMGAVILVLASLLRFKKTGLPNDPRSIATIASLMSHPTIREDFKEVPVNATSVEMERFLQEKQYRLGYFKCANEDESYGIRPVSDTGDDNQYASASATRHRYTPIDGFLPFSDRNTSFKALNRFRIRDAILTILVLGTLGVILAYYLDGSKSGFNNFFNSGTFGPRFVLTLFGTMIASLWKSVEQSVVVIAPYSRLTRNPSSPRSTVLFTPSSTPISATFRTLRHRYFFAAAVTIVTFLAEGLNIVISGIPYATGETLMQFHVSMYMSMAVLGLMIIVLGFLVVARIKEPRIPRKPDTLGAVMSYLAGSHMLDEFEGLGSFVDEESRNRGLCLGGKKYEFREMIRKDGKFGWTVDEVLPRSSYHS